MRAVGVARAGARDVSGSRFRSRHQELNRWQTVTLQNIWDVSQGMHGRSGRTPWTLCVCVCMRCHDMSAPRLAERRAKNVEMARGKPGK
jgi:hypothetical protein